MPFITAQNISKSFDAVSILEDISFDIEQGSIVAMIGPNGAGKSTLAKIILGLIEPTNGTILIDGKNPEKARHFSSYVPQRFPIPARVPISVQEFLYLSLSTEHLSSSKKEKRILENLHEVGMDEHEQTLLSHLSGGQLQRILIARALMQKKKLLVLDEPVASIDTPGKQSMYELVTRMNKNNGITVILISHEMDVVFTYATQVLCINKRMLCHGRPQEAITEEVLQEMYGKAHHHYHHGENR